MRGQRGGGKHSGGWSKVGASEKLLKLITEVKKRDLFEI